ncbi:hypothetical protein Skr01_24050 [Sphaerisporangium krabiense]|uniref:Secreted protein n=1 Tax=Sphaerisporangium krabiense TaxID=763782 RepID=A0A7W8Z677_9ACTN|nr:hypothetical protein [Sphaerisporangium krabiense]MBB5628151.1 hypothetical protein [Sphaerisporangium krabiense]GII62320.1 hypothetical protein Skr01_24050 [Sphaerisporangium krabiense]
MRRRLPAVLLLVLSVFLLSPAPNGAHPAATTASVTLWSAPVAHDSPDAVAPRLHAVPPPFHASGGGAPAVPLWPVAPASPEEPGAGTRPVTAAPAPHAVAPESVARRAPARAPPSTTR